ncbi:ubiquinol-cytochrome c reductase iron-sulfur subunit [Quadrisphaera granulorum]|nr:Rieske (2Fe-2S) protein [Quadrisphaera granulorum]
MLPCSRRALLQRAGVGGAALGAVGLLAACGGTGEPAAPGGDTASGGTGEASSAAGSGGGSGASVAASEVPEGTAVVVDAGGEKVVLAQPSAGQYVAFSAVCTHAGGIVQADSGTEVRCPLHGSVFDAGDGGAVTQGPATAPLPSLTVTPNGDQLVIG